MKHKHTREAEQRFEAERAQQFHRLERRTARRPGTGRDRPDPIIVLRVVTPDAPGLETYFLCRWSLAARLVRDSAADPTSTVEGLVPDALMLAQAAQRGDFKSGELAMVGVARHGRWLRWSAGMLAQVAAVPRR